MAFPLEDIRVLDVSRVLAGPFAGRMLADLGADVVKVEPPEGDATRLYGAVIGGNPGYYHQQNAGKRNVCIDLRAPSGVDLLLGLAEHADVVIENFRAGVADRLGIGYRALSQRNSDLVMLSISGFGQTGPESGRAAYAPVIHAEAGLLLLHARIAGIDQPADFPLSVADTNAGLHGLVAVLAALWMRQRTGLGQHIDLAMLDATLATDDFLHFSLEHSEHTAVLPSEVWDTAAGRLLIAGDFRHIWRLLKVHHGLDEPAGDDADASARIGLRKEVARAFMRSLPDRATVIATLDALNLAWGDVRETADITEQLTVQHRTSIRTIDDREGGTRPIVQSPYRFSAAESGVRGVAPWRGEHNAEVLRDWLGLDERAQEPYAGALLGPL